MVLLSPSLHQFRSGTVTFLMDSDDPLTVWRTKSFGTNGNRNIVLGPYWFSQRFQWVPCRKERSFGISGTGRGGSSCLGSWMTLTLPSDFPSETLSLNTEENRRRQRQRRGSKSVGVSNKVSGDGTRQRFRGRSSFENCGQNERPRIRSLLPRPRQDSVPLPGLTRRRVPSSLPRSHRVPSSVWIPSQPCCGGPPFRQ